MREPLNLRVVLALLLVVGGLCHEDDLHASPRVPRSVNELEGEGRQYWEDKGKEELQAALNLKPNTGKAKNIILFIGDGMSLPTVAATRVYKGQKDGKEDGADEELSWEKFPYVGLSKTYCADYMVSDSAATASAMYSGQKTTFFTMGYDSSVKKGDPSSGTKEAEVSTILDWAQAAGKKTGFVTTTRMSHATPAALYAKTVNRFWEGDQDIKKAIERNETTEQEVADNNVKDISRQLVESEAGKQINIMLGGGRSSFLPQWMKPQNLTNETKGLSFDYEDERDWWDNYRIDNRSLIEEWLQDHPKGIYIENKTDLLNIDANSVDHVMGIFTNSYVTWDDMVGKERTMEKPTLANMSVAAVEFLKAKAGDEGFFIMIEGGRIDAAHHNGMAVRAMQETLAFDKAIQEVMTLVDEKETLVIVTADHAHTMSIGGYTPRTVDITGSMSLGDGWGETDGNFSVLSYGNGPGFRNLKTLDSKGNYTQIDRSNVTLAVDERAHIRFRQPSASPLKSETHGGDDVGIWAVGPWAHLVHTTHQQSYLATVMAYSACLGTYKDREGCTAGNKAPSTQGSGALLPALLAIQALALTASRQAL